MEVEKKPILNKEQEAAAYCEENAVITAGAGSGKTTVLASRYVWLVTEKKYRVREILTLTFTKKAASQMYRKIYLELIKKEKEDSSEKGKLARIALEEFSQARIQTLDSYSAAIVKQAANRYGLSPDFTVDKDRCRQLAMEESLPFIIANRNHPAIERLYPKKSPASIAGDVFASALLDYTYIDSPPDARRDITNQSMIICGEWEKLRNIISKKLEKLAEAYRGNEKYHPDLGPLLVQYNNDKVIFPKEQELRDFFDQLINVPAETVIEWAEDHHLQKSLANVLNFLSSLYNLKMNKGSPRDNPAKAILWELRDLFGEFSSLVVFCRQAGLIYSVLTLLSGLQIRYLNRKRAECVITFNDVSRLAKTILLEQPDIRQNEKESFKAIMIDEFQDNNELQKDLLFLLAENYNSCGDSVPKAENLCGGKLFFVGDEKQSVYLFRGADVSVFRKLKNELGSKDLPLVTNYRSAPELIGAFNTIFGEYPAVFAPEPGIPPYEASYTPLRAHNNNKGKLTLCILDKQDTDEFTEDVSILDTHDILSPAESEAMYIAEKIKTLLSEQKYQPHDIAILFRARSPQYLFEKHLMRLNIPYANEELNSFFFGGPVNDMMSVLRLAAYPTDRAAYAQMLRSPYAGLSMMGLAICLALLKDTAVPFDDGPISRLAQEDRIKYTNGQRIYQNIFNKASTESISSLVSELWYGEGYRYETMWNPQTAAYSELYDYLFHLAVRADEKNQGLAAFTDFILSLETAGERLSDIQIPLERPSAVHLLTVHKSKGLEFPVVFLVCCDKTGRNDHSDDIFDTGTTGLTLNPPLPPELETIKDIKRNYFWERTLAEEKRKKTAELRRLLYVGMTRAENELFLSGCLGISKSLGIDGEKPADSPGFSRNLKLFIDKKIEDKKKKKSTVTGITGDAILEGNTFFGLCLPAFGAHINEENSGNTLSFFETEQIPIRSEQDLQKKYQDSHKSLGAFFEAAESFFKNACIIKTPVVPKRHYSPTALPAESGRKSGGISAEDNTAESRYSGEDASDVFKKVDALLTRYAAQYNEDSEIFNYGSFGTIAHICTEALLAGQESVIPPKLAGPLTPADAEIALDAGNELARRFIHSPLGIMAKDAETRKSEFPFRSLVSAGENGFFINGTIDLVFEDKETVYVIDFKTDSEERPGIHIAQMACYYRAASDLFAVPAQKECRVWLYYLRSGHAVEVTGQARDFIF